MRLESFGGTCGPKQPACLTAQLCDYAAGVISCGVIR